MNELRLYEIKFEHYSQKDSEEGIVCYLAARNDEEVYEYMKTNPFDGKYTHFSNMEADNENIFFDVHDDKYNIIGTETYKEKILRLNGDIDDEDVELSDSYYGVTLFGWEYLSEISEEHLKVGQELGIIRTINDIKGDN